MVGLKILVQVPTFRRGPLVSPHNFCHPEQISTGTPNCFEITKTSLVTEWTPQCVACSLHNLQLPYKSDRWDFSSTSFGETFDNCLWREIPQTGKKGKRGQRAKTLFTFTLNFPGHLHRAVFSILVMFLMFFNAFGGGEWDIYIKVGLYGLWIAMVLQLLMASWCLWASTLCVCIYASSGTDALMPMKVVPYYWVRKGRGRTDGASGEANWPREGSFRRLVKVALWQ